MDWKRGRGEQPSVARFYTSRLRSILRRRWTDYLTLTLLVAVIGGLAMGSAIIGRRTQSSFAAYLAQDDASTLTVSIYGTTNDAIANNYSPSLEAAIRALPGVQSVGAWVGSFILPLLPNGTPIPAANNEVNVAASLDGLYFHQDRVAVLAGRMADPNNPDEFMTSAQGAQALGLHLGQAVTFGIYNPLQVQQSFGTPAVHPASTVQMRLVGIVEFNTQVITDDTDRFPTNLVLTPAYTRTALKQYGTWYGIRLKPGVRDLGSIEHQIVALLPAGGIPNFNFRSSIESRVEAALRPESIALGAFGIFAALAALGICIPVLARLTVNGQSDRAVLRALGAPRRLAAADSWIGAVASLAVGTGLAIGVAVALSTLAPLGPVGRVYHPSALTPDWTVVGAGIALFTAVPGAVVVASSLRSTRRSWGRSSRAPDVVPSRVATVAASAGLPTPAVLGIRFALEPGRGRTAVPARSVIAGAIFTVTLVVATLTFASGLRTLVSRPSLYGWNWQGAIVSPNVVPPQALAALQKDPLALGFSGYSDVNLEVDGQVVPALGANTPATVGPPILSGRQIVGANEIVFGQATLSALGKRVGDTVQVGYGSPSTAPIYLPPRPMRIVGTATFPAIAGSSTFAVHVSMGTGALFSYLSLPQSFLNQISNPADPTQDGPSLVFVHYRPGVTQKLIEADEARIVAVANNAFAADPAAIGDADSYLGVQRPAAIVNYQSSGNTPLVLALGLAVGAMVALGLSLVASVQRRRRDLAVLKTLGFTRAQVTAAVASQALVVAAIADAVGIPLGIAAGRQLWIAFARSIDAVPVPTVPSSVAIVGLSAVVGAIAVAVVPGRLAARTPAATVLRAP